MTTREIEREVRTLGYHAVRYGYRFVEVFTSTGNYLGSLHPIASGVVASRLGPNDKQVASIPAAIAHLEMR